MKKNLGTKSKIKKREARIRGFTYAVVLCFVMISLTNVIHATLRNNIFEEIDVKQIAELDAMEKEIQREITEVSTYTY